MPVPPTLFHLATTGAFNPTAPDSLPAEVSGLPAFYYWKDAITVGTYRHPARNFSLHITRQTLDSYAGAFARMKSNGVAVPILMDHAPTAASTLGWIIDIQRDGDRLLELHQFLGESARDIGIRNKVSLGIDPNFVDGKGVSYGQAIVHSAVTPVPVVQNQGNFEPVRLSANDEGDDPAGNEMEHETESGLIMLSLQEEEADMAIPSHKTTPFPLPQPALLSATHSLPNQAPTISGPTLNTPASHGLPAASGNFALTLLTHAAAAKRDLAVARGGVTPCIAEELFKLLLSFPTNPQTLTLDTIHDPSASSAITATTPLALMIFDILARNHPARLGELTPIQILSRLTPGEDPGKVQLQERMIALANGQHP